jgi:tetratricopeptide (TPR) repeat protein
LKKTVFPTDLTVLYPHPALVDPDPLPRLIAPAVVGLLLVGLTTLCVIGSARRRPYLAVGWFWFLGTLFPVIGLFQVGQQQMADRYTYVANIGISMAATWLVASVMTAPFWRRGGLAGLGLLILLLLTPVACRQAGYWQSSFTLYRHALHVTNHNYMAHFNLGTLLHVRNELDGALYHYQRAAHIKPNFVAAHNNAGKVLFARGHFDEAARHYEMAIRLDPRFAAAYSNLGEVRHAQNRFDEALKYCRNALELAPNLWSTHLELGRLYLDLGDLGQAQRHLLLADQLQPGSEEVRAALRRATSK